MENRTKQGISILEHKSFSFIFNYSSFFSEKLEFVALQRFPGLQIIFSRPKGTCFFGTDHISIFSFIENEMKNPSPKNLDSFRNICQILQPQGRQNSVSLIFFDFF